jgi:hypothetical protein
MLSYLDNQLSTVKLADETPTLPDTVWTCLATSIYDEIATLDEVTVNRLRHALPIPPERYREEMEAFQSWMTIAHSNAGNPVIVRAQVMTQLYVAFVWLRDALMRPVVEAMANDSLVGKVEKFLGSGKPRNLRNAVAHGRWCYLPDFDGLEFWDGPRHDNLKRFQITGNTLGAWQTLSRGVSIATLLALTGENDGH